MKLRRHPKTEVLKEWLEGGGSAEVDAHIATCLRCAESLERFDDELPLADETSASVSDALAAVLRPPEDLTDRLEERVVARLDSRVMFGVVADLFGAGLEASKLLFTEEPPNDKN